MPMRRFVSLASLLFCPLASLLSTAEQFPPPPDPLARIKAAPGEGCSVSEASQCAEATGKIIAGALGPSPLEENLRQLTDEVGGRMTGSPARAPAAAGATGAVRRAGLDAG